jgi:glutaminyl-peptide cyclotransferase
MLSSGASSRARSRGERRTKLSRWHKLFWIGASFFAALHCVACSHGAAPFSSAASGTAGAVAATSTPSATPAPPASESAPPASQTGGFDGQKAYDFTAKLVAFGPRPPASDAIHHTQEYIDAQLHSFGCQVDEDDFHASTPIGNVAMKNIVAKAPGTGQGIILLLTHYDSLRRESHEFHGTADFVGAVDSGSSTGLMLEMARLLCAQKAAQPNSVWMGFVDGEEAFVDWNTDNDNTYGSRQLAAGMAASGDLKRIRAVILADMVGPTNLLIKREENSTPWLADLVWKTAASLGYKDYFVSERARAISDDHLSFTHRGVAAVDIIDLNDYPYWHTSDDTMDKVSPRSLAIVGHVILETVNELQKKLH